MKKKLLFVHDYQHYADPFLNYFEVTKTNLVGADVILFTGGTDISSSFYGEPPGKHTQGPAKHRDAKEKLLFEYGMEHGKKFLGICRGAQLLCALAGGKLAQHIEGHAGRNHSMMTNTGEEYTMSTLHHQMMLPAGTDHEMIAWTEKLSHTYLNGYNKEIKGIEVEPEIVYFKKIKALGIQGHPEFLRDAIPEEERTLQYVSKLVEERLLN